MKILSHAARSGFFQGLRKFGAAKILSSAVDAQAERSPGGAGGSSLQPRLAAASDRADLLDRHRGGLDCNPTGQVVHSSCANARRRAWFRATLQGSRSGSQRSEPGTRQRVVQHPVEANEELP